jgi:hypothetical protein
VLTLHRVREIQQKYQNESFFQGYLVLSKLLPNEVSSVNYQFFSHNSCTFLLKKPYDYILNLAVELNVFLNEVILHFFPTCVAQISLMIDYVFRIFEIETSPALHAHG